VGDVRGELEADVDPVFVADVVLDSTSNSAAIAGAGVVAGAGTDGRQETGDVLKKEPPWAQFVGQPHDLPEQS
jgi:hypothetical protein